MAAILEIDGQLSELIMLEQRSVKLQMAIDVRDALAIARLIKDARKIGPVPREAERAADFYLSNLQQALGLLNCPRLARAATE